MCGDIIFLIELLKKNKFKNLLIIVQIVISVFYLTFFLIPITEAIDTDILMKKLNMKNDIAFFDEAQHISFLPENYNNDRYEELKNIMKNINNVEEVGSVYTIVGSERNLYGMIIYDQLVYNTIKLDLKEGKWFDNSDIDKEIIPVVISNKLGDTYKINSVFSTNVFLDENMTVKEELTFKVIGILKNKTYVYTGGANHSDCSIADLFIKTTPNDEIVIMPNIFEKMPLYWANNGMIIKTNDYIETYKSIKEKGIGKISSLEDISKNNINNIFIYNEQKIYEFIIVFVFIIMSIGGYNTLANLEYKRLLTIYYITGITWKKGIALLTIRNFIIIVIPTIIFSIFSNKIVTYLRTLYTYNEKNVYITLFIYIGIFILTTAVTVIGLRDKKPIHEHTSVVPPWFTASLRIQPRCCGSMCCLQPDAVTGASRCGLSTPAPRPHGSETIFSFLFPALFHRPGSLVRINAKAYSSLHSHFCDIDTIITPSAAFVNTFNEVFG